MIRQAVTESGSVTHVSARPGSGPTVLRIMLGTQLRRLREAKQISLAEAGDVIRASHSKISRLETGRVGFKDRDIADLLTLYGVTDEEEREAVRALARRASAAGWWHDYSDILPGWFEAYVGLEEAAAQIRAYEVQYVPGLLQTREYVRAVTLTGYPDAPATEIERRVSLRMARQALLDREDAPNLWVVLDEAALRRPYGGWDVMRGQLAHLIEMAQRPRVTLQVVPFEAGGHAAAGGPFSILRFAEPDLPDVVYLEQLASALYLDKPEVVDNYLLVMERLCMDATTPADSITTLEAMLREH
jgi:transcriptional regulator with XRE-family HTH domain